MQHLFYYYWLFVVGTKKISGSGRFLALNLTVPLGSGQMILGTGLVRASILSPCRPLHLVGPPLAFRTASILRGIDGCWKHKVMETFLKDFGPYRHDSIMQLLQICRLHIHDVNLSFHHIPRVLYWFEIW